MRLLASRAERKCPACRASFERLVRLEPGPVPVARIKTFEATAEEYHVKVLQLVNKKQSEEKVSVCSRGNVAEVTLPESSITTARW